MIYLTGSSGMVGSRFMKVCNDRTITPVSYRGTVPDVFESHENACLIHAAWSTTTRTPFSQIEEVYRRDLFPSQQLFQKFAEKNPEGKIIFLSTAGAAYTGYERTVAEDTVPNPKSLYGETKMQVEKVLKEIDCDTVSLRISNIWGVKGLPSDRKNGLIDKLIDCLDTDRVVDLYANLDTRIDIIHVDDLISLILKVVDAPSDIKHQMYLVGAQSLTIKDVLDKVTAHGTLRLNLSRSENKNYLHVENGRVKRKYNWNPTHRL